MGSLLHIKNIFLLINSCFYHLLTEMQQKTAQALGVLGDSYKSKQDLYLQKNLKIAM